MTQVCALAKTTDAEQTYDQRSRILDQVDWIPGSVGHGQSWQQRKQIGCVLENVVEQNIETHEQHLTFCHRAINWVTAFVDQSVEIAAQLRSDSDAIRMWRLKDK